MTFFKYCQYANENLNNNFLNFRQKINIGKNSILKNYSLDIMQIQTLNILLKILT